MTVSQAQRDRPIRVQRRRDLRESIDVCDGKQRWVVKDPVSMSYHQMGREEHFLFERLDGNTSFGELQTAFETPVCTLQGVVARNRIATRRISSQRPLGRRRRRAGLDAAQATQRKATPQTLGETGRHPGVSVSWRRSRSLVDGNLSVYRLVVFGLGVRGLASAHGLRTVSGRCAVRANCKPNFPNFPASSPPTICS